MEPNVNDEWILSEPSQQPTEQNQGGVGQFLTSYGAAPLARAGEQFLGFPGMLESLGTGLVQKATGMTPAQVPGILDIGKSLVTGKPLEYSGNVFPTPEQIRENVTKPLTGQTLEPKNRKQQVAQDLFADFASLKPGMSLGKAANLSVIGNLISETAKWLGHDTTGDVLKTGAYIAGSFPGLYKQFSDKTTKLYGRARELAKDARVETTGLSNFLEAAQKEHGKEGFIGTEKVHPRFDPIVKSIESIPATAEQQAAHHEQRIKSINEAYEAELRKNGLVFDKKAIARRDAALANTEKEASQLKSGKTDISVNDLIERKQEVNEWIREMEEKGGVSPKGIRKLRQVRDKLNSYIQKFGAKNPEFGEVWNEAEQRYMAQNERSAAGKFMEKHINADLFKHPVMKVLYHTPVVGWGMLPLAAGSIGAAHVAKYATRVTDLLMRSPEARKMYFKSLAAASKGNSKLMNGYARKVEQVIKADETSDEWDYSEQ